MLTVRVDSALALRARSPVKRILTACLAFVQAGRNEAMSRSLSITRDLGFGGFDSRAIFFCEVLTGEGNPT